jgi:hypothetical protein
VSSGDNKRHGVEREGDTKNWKSIRIIMATLKVQTAILLYYYNTSQQHTKKEYKIEGEKKILLRGTNIIIFFARSRSNEMNK